MAAPEKARVMAWLDSEHHSDPANSIRNHSHPTEVPGLFLESLFQVQRKGESWPHVTRKALNTVDHFSLSLFVSFLLGGFQADQKYLGSPQSQRSLSPFTSPPSGREEYRGTKRRRVDAYETSPLVAAVAPKNQRGWRRRPPSS